MAEEGSIYQGKGYDTSSEGDEGVVTEQVRESKEEDDSSNERRGNERVTDERREG